jgi:hypothetical protein
LTEVLDPMRDFGVCRGTFRDGGNPNAAGGWILLDHSPRPLLCLSGTLEDIDAARLLEAVSSIPSLDVAVRSAGGPVTVWLQLGERLLGRVNDVYVDEACFSSCANYVIPLARQVVAGKNSLVVWHGGPNPKTSEPLEGADVGDAIEYDELARRTGKLYEAVGVNVSLLAFTASPPSRRQLSRVVGPEAIGKPISGYAVSPRRLSECFGFRNLGGMWHAGDDKAVYALGKHRSARLAILESPDLGDKASSFCGVEGATGWNLRDRPL